MAHYGDRVAADCTCVALGFEIDPVIESEHHHHRQPEGQGGGDEGKWFVHNEPELEMFGLHITEIKCCIHQKNVYGVSGLNEIREIR